MRLIKQYIPAVLSLLFFLTLLEVGSYGILEYFEKNGINKSGKAFIDNQLGELNYKTTIIPNAYSLYWNNPDYRDYEYGSIYNSNGYRSKELDGFSSDTIRILALGGSTTNVWPYIKGNKKI